MFDVIQVPLKNLLSAICEVLPYDINAKRAKLLFSDEGSTDIDSDLSFPVQLPDTTELVNSGNIPRHILHPWGKRRFELYRGVIITMPARQGGRNSVQVSLGPEIGETRALVDQIGRVMGVPGAIVGLVMEPDSIYEGGEPIVPTLMVGMLFRPSGSVCTDGRST